VGKKKRVKQTALWNEARELAVVAARILTTNGCRDPKDWDISELHNRIYLGLGGKPSNPKRRPM
jgi:hypothetical protein